MRNAQWLWLMIYGNYVSTLICSSNIVEDSDSDSDGVEYKFSLLQVYGTLSKLPRTIVNIIMMRG